MSKSQGFCRYSVLIGYLCMTAPQSEIDEYINYLKETVAFMRDSVLNDACLTLILEI